MHQNTAVGVNDTLQCSYGVWHRLLYLDGFDAVGLATGGATGTQKDSASSFYKGSSSGTWFYLE